MMKMTKIVMVFGMMIGLGAYAHETGTTHEHGEDAYDENEVIISMHTDERGVSYKLAVEAAKMHASPKWNGVGDPPVSVGRSFELAIAWLKENRSDFSRFYPERYEIQRIWQDGLEDRWTATVWVRAEGELGPVTVQYQFQVAVLLDETVVGPEKIQEE